MKKQFAFYRHKISSLHTLTAIFCLLSLFPFPYLVEAQYTELHDFVLVNGAAPFGSLTASVSGNVLYGMTYAGGGGDGTIFSMNTNGTGYKVIYVCGPNTKNPYGSLLLSGHKLYGMSYSGGIYGYGNIFSIDTNGTNYLDLEDCNSSTTGSLPEGSLILSGSLLYGMAQGGGQFGAGFIFSIDTDGTGFTSVYSFSSANSYPQGSLTLSGNVLFGMTYGGGLYSDGYVFSVKTNGTGFKYLLYFNGTNGYQAHGDLTLSGNKLFGMTYGGGAHGLGCVFSIDTNGLGYNDLLDFSSSTGEYPYGDVTVAGSKLFGMTSSGGANDSGRVFSIDTDGTGYSDLVDFNNTGFPQGGIPRGSLLLSNGVFYGMTEEGGASNDGVIFKFDTSTVSTSINQLIEVSDFWSVYPNPSSGIFQFTIPIVIGNNSQIIIKNIEVYNLLGEKVYAEILPQTPKGALSEIDLRGQPNGVFFYRVLGEDGGIEGEGKLVISK